MLICINSFKRFHNRLLKTLGFAGKRIKAARWRRTYPARNNLNDDHLQKNIVPGTIRADFVGDIVFIMRSGLKSWFQAIRHFPTRSYPDELILLYVTFI